MTSHMHLHFLKTSVVNSLSDIVQCNCFIGTDHMDNEPAIPKVNAVYFTRKNSTDPWHPVTKAMIKMMVNNTYDKDIVIDSDSISKVIDINSLYPYEPKAVYPVWLNENEKESLIAIWEKQGLLGSIVEKIRSAENTKGIR